MENEARFGVLSPHTMDLIDSNAKEFRHFRLDISSKIVRILSTFYERDYTDLVEMVMETGIRCS